MMLKKRRALFLDRDGVINVDYAYVHRQENFEFIDGIFELVAAANSAGYLVIVVTNQAGIGRGYYTESEFHELTKWMCDEFLERGATVNAVYFCPFHPIHGVGDYKRESENRKPNPGMILQAAKDYSIDLSASIIIGDNISDVEAGRNAGISNILLFNSDRKNHKAILLQKLMDAICFIKQVEEYR